MGSKSKNLKTCRHSSSLKFFKSWIRKFRVIFRRISKNRRMSNILNINFWLKMNWVWIGVKKKKYLLHGRLNARLFELGINYDQYYDLLINNQETKEKELFYNFVTTNKTEFFREPSIFLWIRDNILPPLREQIVSGKKKKIRFWSAGCSSGEEAYSLSFETHAMAGMLSHEKEAYRILGTDINTQAIVSAYKGIYSQELVKNLPQSVLNKFFVPVASNDRRSKLFVIKDFIKNLIQFRVLNFLDDHYPIATQFDIILCRNVLYAAVM